MMAWFWLGCAVAIEAVATMTMRANVGAASLRPFLLVLGGYALAFWSLALALSMGIPVGVAYGVWAASGVVLTAVLARLIFQDPLTWRMGLGFLCIGVGVLLINLG